MWPDVVLGLLKDSCVGDETQQGGPRATRRSCLRRSQYHPLRGNPGWSLMHAHREIAQWASVMVAWSVFVGVLTDSEPAQVSANSQQQLQIASATLQSTFCPLV